MSSQVYSRRRARPGMDIRRQTSSRMQARTAASNEARAVKIAARRPASTAAQAIRTGGWANPATGPEKKFVDTSSTFNPAFATVTFVGPTLVNGIATGTDASTRIGRKAIMKSILLRFTCSLAATSTAGGSFRILVVYDKQANATAPAVTDILLADAFNSPNNLSNRDRFVTIFDHLSDPIDAGGPHEYGGTLYKKINLETMWNAGTDALIGSIASGSIYIIVAQSGSIGTANPAVTIRTRVRYTDN